jgi:hypothetical protein
MSSSVIARNLLTKSNRFAQNMPEDARNAMYENAAAHSTVKRVATADDIADAVSNLSKFVQNYC